MAKLKSDKPEQLPSAVEDPNKSGKVLDERWFVEEYYPPRVDSNGMTVPESWNRNYSEVFATESEANSWIAKHVPDYEDGKFRKIHEVLREVAVAQWMLA